MDPTQPKPTRLHQALAHARAWEQHYVPKLPPPAAAQDRLADRITAFAGSMPFVYIHVAWFAAWVGWNVWLVPFDPFPFGFLTLVVSLEAIFLSTFVMIAQNRLSAESDARAKADYEVNVRAEAEIARMTHLLQSLVEHHIDDHERYEALRDQLHRVVGRLEE